MSEQRDYGNPSYVIFPMLIKGGANDGDHATLADWTPAAGEVIISQDTTDFVNTTNLPVPIGPAPNGRGLWALTLSAAEMMAVEIGIFIEAAGVKHQAILITTRGGPGSHDTVAKDATVLTRMARDPSRQM